MDSSNESQVEQNNAGQFATTHWSLVLAAGNRGHEDSSRALEKLCRAYWPPLYAYVRRRVSDVHEAQDLTQAFFERLLEKEFLADAEKSKRDIEYSSGDEAAAIARTMMNADKDVLLRASKLLGGSLQ